MAVEVPLLKVPHHVLAACQQGGRHLTPENGGAKLDHGSGGEVLLRAA